jgi:hypothetical protein
LQYQQLRHTIDQQGRRCPANCISSAPSPPPTAICRRSSTASAPRIRRWKLSSPPAPPTRWKSGDGRSRSGDCR